MREVIITDELVKIMKSNPDIVATIKEIDEVGEIMTAPLERLLIIKENYDKYYMETYNTKLTWKVDVEEGSEMEKIVKTMEDREVVNKLINKQKEVEESFSEIIDKMKKMEDEVYEMRQKINHSFGHMITKSEKTLLVGQLRVLTNTINQMEETLRYFKNDKANEISDEIWENYRKEGK